MNDNDLLKQFDETLLGDNSDVAAIVIREQLRPVQGIHAVFFPPTFAAIGQGRKSDYHVDRIGPRSDDPEGAEKAGETANRCTVDSVPSQANRMESRLLRHSGTYIPKVTISGSRVGQRPLDLLEVGHRIGDAVLRYTADNGFQPFEEALRAFVAGDCGPMARLAPTSIVFGHWDSRGETKSKGRRLVRGEIVAYNVKRITRRSQYWSNIDPEVNEELGQILQEAKEAAQVNPETKNPASQLGMTDVPAPESPGGIIAFGRIERTAIIALSQVRALATFAKPKETEASPNLDSVIDPDGTLALRRYLFALALASLAGKGVWDLREGCILVRNGAPPLGSLKNGESPMSSKIVRYTGDEDTFEMPNDLEKYLELAKNAFFSDKFPDPRPLIFAPTAAMAAIVEKQGGKSAEPKTKDDFVKALLARPEFAGQEAELKKKKKAELQELWKQQQDSGDASQPAPQQENTDSVGGTS